MLLQDFYYKNIIFGKMFLSCITNHNKKASYIQCIDDINIAYNCYTICYIQIFEFQHEINKQVYTFLHFDKIQIINDKYNFYM